jgi:hypothetical protein
MAAAACAANDKAREDLLHEAIAAAPENGE